MLRERFLYNRFQVKTLICCETPYEVLDFEAWLKSSDALSGIVSSSASLFSRRYLEKGSHFIVFLPN